MPRPPRIHVPGLAVHVCQRGIDRRTIYLVPESTNEPDRERLLEEFWRQIFEEELALWMEDDSTWPAPLTRDLFDAWFEAEVTSRLLADSRCGSTSPMRSAAQVFISCRSAPRWNRRA